MRAHGLGQSNGPGFICPVVSTWRMPPLVPLMLPLRIRSTTVDFQFYDVSHRRIIQTAILTAHMYINVLENLHRRMCSVLIPLYI